MTSGAFVRDPVRFEATSIDIMVFTDKFGGSQSRHVNNLLHTLRGEHFRHQQNVSRSRSHLRLTATHSLQGSLPDSLIFAPTLDADSSNNNSTSQRSLAQDAILKPAGPAAPKSWTAREDAANGIDENTSIWRSAALALILSKVPVPTCLTPCNHTHDRHSVVPTLSRLCLRFIRQYFMGIPDTFVEDILPHLAPHLRRDLVRESAVHAPLGNPYLQSLYEPYGHAEGEIIVVGPVAYLRPEWLQREDAANQTGNDWDADDHDSAVLRSLILMSTKLSQSTMGQLPATLTTIALISVPEMVPIHRLVRSCPNLASLDVSFNASWLHEKLFNRVEWSRWHDLTFLAIRDCQVPESVVRSINNGRWVEVEIVL